MLNGLAELGRTRCYWIALLLLGLAFEAVALYYQYGLGEYPCVLCIQVRLWFAALVLVALPVVFLHRARVVTVVGHVLVAVIGLGLLERSWKLLGTERGFAEGECGFALGLPAWFTPDTWLPKLFEVQTSCGYTPELPLGITMAEFLIVFSALFALFAVMMLVASLLRGPQSA